MALFRTYTTTDRCLQRLQRILPFNSVTRPSPAMRESDLVDNVLTTTEKHHSASLMRVNHSGEVAAQALYLGQALVARNQQKRLWLERAAEEETDHLFWCADRVLALGGRTSCLNPFWYIGSFCIGVLAGVCGDEVSLGFVAETETQVGMHLQGHLQRLPTADVRSRVVLQQMIIDERHHGDAAIQQGGKPLPQPIPALMRITGRIMTTTAYYI